jgi:16S rRNA (guanine966-N2)-methyltransferase
LRIVAGQFRGTALASVGKGEVGAHLRPTTDRVRESLFNVLQGGRFGDPIDGAQVLDMFAGTGALGLEALSRGAAHVTFVDDGRKAQSLIAENIRLTRSQGNTKLLRRNALKLLKNERTACDLVFLDPPYGKALGQKALAAAQAGGWIAPGALIVWEEESPQVAPEGFELLESRKFGGTVITFLEAPE